MPYALEMAPIIETFILTVILDDLVIQKVSNRTDDFTK